MSDTKIFILIITVVLGTIITVGVMSDRSETRACKKFFETSKTAADTVRVVQLKPTCANRMK